MRRRVPAPEVAGGLTAEGDDPRAANPTLSPCFGWLAALLGMPAAVMVMRRALAAPAA